MRSTAGQAQSERLWSLLRWSLLVYLALVVAHDVDHLFSQEQRELTAFFWAFLPFQYGVILLTVAVVWRRDPRAPLLAALLGAVGMLGFAGAHVIPGGLQPLGDYDVSAISWTLVIVPMAVSVLVLAVGLRLRLALAEPERAAAPSAAR